MSPIPHLPTKSQNDLSSGFHLADGRGYMLDRGYFASSRLNFQFYLWKESLHFNLHPSISTPVQNLRVADVATGTGLWLFDLARELPESAQLDGFDISLANAPHKQWWPQNVTLRQWDIFDDVPEEMIGKYDIVHLRLLILVVENSDPRPIIQKVHKMLKPGGYIQWDDLNYPDTHVRTPLLSSSTSTPAFDSLREFVYSNGRHDWVLQLPGILTSEGFEGARQFNYVDRPDLTKANGDQHLLTMEEFATTLAAAGNRQASEKIFNLIGDVYQESLAGAALSMPRVVSIARKQSGDTPHSVL
ncbi:hypothetical protein MGYG_04495 [Nannizzia gypsea CBS 118893]|uniref:Methyltransferase domain-containing protein n=1 Tax=Arthroderma gypseum (strain ATCC MYA-4604 / CBS 118893) TaxID=535722 RepID=E4UTE2_ARTGP|nr:hypothetical protein MGYG_04495 [Nannizzia gypsea CBS 118893]EFR01487.1 hypothetical protein MGYG_04495 [Nannizzia gypsea CBS 118893]